MIDADAFSSLKMISYFVLLQFNGFWVGMNLWTILLGVFLFTLWFTIGILLSFDWIVNILPIKIVIMKVIFVVVDIF